jgi:DNA polymerase-3 subunit gamma/tau
MMSDLTGPESYRVLARKYRPSSFAELVGQEAMVRTLGNAFELDRIAQAFILTGVRGVGKTTTARIIAKALNCVGPDGKGGPTIDLCGQCESCVAIAEDRHVDVLEIDAASHTGVDQMRDIIDGVRYLPATARYKVYILDEVHMLTKQAFNALLKTLEEPPPHVKFIFATTEIRKVPVTVLSRCQRFDLRRLDGAALAAHLGNIAAKESAAIDDEALKLISRAAEGSVRDGLSLLDQAISFSTDKIESAQVREMLGLADRAEIIDLFEHTMSGRMPDALALVRKQYEFGADPIVIIQDLLTFTHWLTRLKVAESAIDDLAASEAERERGKALSGALSVAELTRAWQLLLKGLNEVLNSPLPLAALEMVLIRLAHAADLPVPADLVRTLKDAPPASAASVSASTPETASAAASTASATGTAPTAPVPGNGGAGAATALAQDQALPESVEATPASQPEPAAQPQAQSQSKNDASLMSYREVVQLAADKGDMQLFFQLRTNIHVVKFEPGQIEIRLGERAPENMPNRLGEFLKNATGDRWLISVSLDEGEQTLETQDAERHAEAAAHPLVKKVLEAFPGAEIRAVRDVEPPTSDIPDDNGDDEEDD